MDYIVLDLEWNQPMSYDSHVFKAVGDQLIFEMIQIGAVKLDPELRIVDSISLPIRPTQYIKLHPRIKRMTQLDPEELENAPAFPEVMETFSDWCGQEYALCTWGCDDVSVLQQNLDFHQCSVKLPPLCDIQRLFGDTFHLGKNRKGLKAAMELMQIDPQEDRNFHNALNDAYYTALVFSRLPDPKAVVNYPQQPRKLMHVERKRRMRAPAVFVPSVAQALLTEAEAGAKCPLCGRRAALDAPFAPQAGDRYVALATCRDHGPLFVRLQFTLMEDGQKSMTASVSLASAVNVAYVHTKQWQATQNASSEDPDQALAKAIRSFMPFDD